MWACFTKVISAEFAFISARRCCYRRPAASWLVRRAVPAGQAPQVRAALEQGRDDSLFHVILDGKVIPSDRCTQPAAAIPRWPGRGSRRAAAGASGACCRPRGPQAAPAGRRCLTAGRAGHAVTGLSGGGWLVDFGEARS
jgi:hypothetical protein